MPSRQPPPAEPLPDSPASNHQHHHPIPHHHHPIPAAAVVAAASAAVCLAVGLAVLLYRRLARGRAAPTAPSPPLSLPNPLRRFSYAHLRRATASFSPSLKLGQGGFGPVFRGALPSSGEEVAVKLMDAGSLQGEREFQNELALAAKILSMPTCTDRASVVPPVGYCSDDRHLGRGRRWWRWWLRWWRRKPPADESPELFEACVSSPTGAAAAPAPGRRLLLVYELMHNGSLQDALLDRRCPELMDWERRFAVVLDVARGLQFLHCVCDPPVIHGDIKPSNILLDARLSAKIGDFGLARIKSTVAADDELPAEGETAVVIDLDKAVGKYGKEDSLTGGGGEGGCVGEDDASIMAESTTTTGFEDQTMAGGENSFTATAERSQEEDEGLAVASPKVVSDVPSPSETGGGFDRASVDSGMETMISSSHKCGQKKSGALSGKDWWWRQDGNGGGANSESGGSVKDYVMEWIRSEIKKERPRSDWANAPTSAEECLPKPCSGGRMEQKKSSRLMKWWALLDEEKIKKKEKSRPAREWWREEFCEELTNKQKKRAIAAKLKSSIEGGEEKQWWQKDEDFAPPLEKRKRRKKKSFSCSSRSSMDWWMDGISGEFRSTGRRSCRDWPSCDIPKSGTVSSTPSMRGTVCYVAPEYAGGGPLSEKCDIYSFGVLLLVIISGRRPLQVTASPMSEFERANLISWARHLARSGRLLDLVDPSLRGMDREQALLCITVGLLCLQRSPARRPSIKEIFSMLTGKSEPPNLPLEFSPSPPGGFSFKSRKKVR